MRNPFFLALAFLAALTFLGRFAQDVERRATEKQSCEMVKR